MFSVDEVKEVLSRKYSCTPALLLEALEHNAKICICLVLQIFLSVSGFKPEIGVTSPQRANQAGATPDSDSMCSQNLSWLLVDCQVCLLLDWNDNLPPNWSFLDKI